MNTLRRRVMILGSLLVALLPLSLLPLTRASDTNGPSFKTRCGYVRSAHDDPLVHPGMEGMSHLHDFFGSTFTGSTVTQAMLAASGTSCKNQGDHAAYWAPALFRNGVQVVPDNISAYYLNRSGQRTVPYPDGLRMLGGDPMATAPQSKDIAMWACDDGVEGAKGGPQQLPIEPCPNGRTLNMVVRFPACWDGRNLDSADHRSHVAYLTGTRCPASHPVQIPELRLHVHYPDHGGGNLTLASGSVWSAHADFINGWDPPTLKLLTEACLNLGRRCR